MRLVALLLLGALLAGCGSGGHSSAPPTGSAPPTPTSHPVATQRAPGLEAALPKRLDGTVLSRASTTGATIFREFGDTAFAKQMTAFLAHLGKTPADLHYAQVWDPSRRLHIDAGVFEVRGVGAAALARGIIESSRPDSPSMTVSNTTLAGKRVTVVVNPSAGSTLYLYPRGTAVFYVGADNSEVAKQYLSALR